MAEQELVQGIEERPAWSRPSLTRVGLEVTAYGGGSNVDGFEPDPGDKKVP
jgi:hypothetical protein